MYVSHTTHLTYCTNIHPGESWEEVFDSLRHTIIVKHKLRRKGPFGIGLRLSAKAANELARTQVLRSFQDWLRVNDCYVFTMNGFPYGGFHEEAVKANVHEPDWTSRKRVVYTNLLFDLLAELLPGGMDGGVSTSPLSYKPWFSTPAALQEATDLSAQHVAEVLRHLDQLKQTTGKSLHLDIEPEPDGVLENSTEFVAFFDKMLALEDSGLTPTQIREHLALCWDVCHFAVAYEQPAEVLSVVKQNGIRVGKIQISAAIKADLTGDRRSIQQALRPYDEPVYLHQAALRDRDGNIAQFPDLAPALEVLHDERYTELRTHFHVPIYTDSYGHLQSTNDAIVETLQLWCTEPFTNHLEVETYTWDVLPDHQQLGLTDSIVRELEWVSAQLPDAALPTPDAQRAKVAKATSDASRS